MKIQTKQGAPLCWREESIEDTTFVNTVKKGFLDMEIVGKKMLGCSIIFLGNEKRWLWKNITLVDIRPSCFLLSDNEVSVSTHIENKLTLTWMQFDGRRGHGMGGASSLRCRMQMCWSSTSHDETIFGRVKFDFGNGIVRAPDEAWQGLLPDIFPHHFVSVEIPNRPLEDGLVRRVGIREGDQYWEIAKGDRAAFGGPAKHTNGIFGSSVQFLEVQNWNAGLRHG
ncbi:hypothetical protein DFH05DRAFT_1605013 [Lentinula detonsa]|uniref:Uncharacterized protein n=1 Tax=Lentinula detonsa TaxID=2804962 RepID=A0A9W8TYW0_9AGAR|nr:hypothetical protein DFH05DRAFT_1605013 [Lentinula detonsa]